MAWLLNVQSVQVFLAPLSKKQQDRTKKKKMGKKNPNDWLAGQKTVKYLKGEQMSKKTLPYSRIQILCLTFLKKSSLNDNCEQPVPLKQSCVCFVNKYPLKVSIGSTTGDTSRNLLLTIFDHGTEDGEEMNLDCS